MGIAVGQLELLISALGADKAVADIQRVDAAATAAGTRPHSLNVDAKSATDAANTVTASAASINAALGRTSAGAAASYKAVAGAMKAEVAGVETVAKESASKVDASLRASLANANRTSTLMQRLAASTPRGGSALGRAAGAVGSVARTAASEAGDLLGFGASAIGGTLGRIASSTFGQLGLVFGAAGLASGVVSTIGSAITASNTLATSLRVLESTSKLTGVPLSFLRMTSDQLSRSLGISSTNMNGMVAVAARFTSAVGRTNDTGVFLTRWLELAASRGLSASAAMQALETTMMGQDEGLNKLGLMNPSGIYEKWAASMHTTAGKMSDVQKQQAIVNEVMTEGAKVQGAYAERMQTAEGAAERLTNAKQSFLVALGQAITGGTSYNGVLGTFADLLQTGTTWVTTNQSAITALVGTLGSLASAITGIVNSFLYLSAQGDVIDAWFWRWQDPAKYQAALARAAELKKTQMAGYTGPTAPAPAMSSLFTGAGAAGPTQQGLAIRGLNAFNQLGGSLDDPFGTRGTVTASLNAPLIHTPTAAEIAAEKKAAKARVAAAHAAMTEALTEQRPALQAMEAGSKANLPGVGMTGSSPVGGRFGASVADLMGDPSARSAEIGRVLSDHMSTHPVAIKFRFEAAAGSLAAEAIKMRATVNQSFQNMGVAAAGAFGTALSAGIQGFANGPITFGAFLKNFGNSLLSGLGAIFTQMGSELLVYGAIMSGLLPFLTNPFTSGPAAMAAGVALIAAGSILGAIATKNSGGGGRSGGRGESFNAPVGGDITTRTTLGPRAAPVGGQMAPTGRSGTPTTQAPFIFAPTIIGTRDPVAQRQLAQMVYEANQRRGITGKG